MWKKIIRNFGIISLPFMSNVMFISCSQNIEEIIQQINKIDKEISYVKLTNNSAINKNIIQLKSLYNDWKINQNRVLNEWASFAREGDKNDDYTNKWLHLIFLSIANKFYYFLTNIKENKEIDRWEKWRDELQNFHYEYEIYFRESFIETIFQLIEKNKNNLEENIFKLQSLLVDINLLINTWKKYKSNEIQRQAYAISKKEQKFYIFYEKIKSLGKISKENYYYEFYTRAWKAQELLNKIKNSNTNNNALIYQVESLLKEMNLIFKRWI
ncbi:hypothetical protein [Mycoplasma phocimorsus]|uniref:hypothetical protein n=1 Tax=Mycoplasma phocimorsus TaxID=3045839 RepID=UPI0024C08B4B|nr:hypothetical protein [Mycoplasma phocimorsus]MDJ1648482.1 hypothetical protein [Mycoplasma phocimorsus]